jgi:hypothetical protein
MTVAVVAKDSDGVLLQTNIALLTAQLAATSSTLTKESLRIKLDSAQREFVYHCLDVGRITAATIISTLS